MGYSSDKAQQDRIRNESETHHDIVQGIFLDTYKNLTYKTVMGHMWASRFCPQAEFVVKADDDIYLDLYALYTVASRYKSDKVREGFKKIWKNNVIHHYERGW